MTTLPKMSPMPRLRKLCCQESHTAYLHNPLLIDYLFYRKIHLSYLRGKLINEPCCGIVQRLLPSIFPMDYCCGLCGRHFWLPAQKRPCSNGIFAQKTHIWPCNKRKSSFELDQSYCPHSFLSVIDRTMNSCPVSGQWNIREVCGRASGKDFDFW